MPAHDAVQGRRFQGKLPDLDRIGAAEFQRRLRPRIATRFDCTRTAPAEEIGHVGGHEAGAVAGLEELIQKTGILRARTDAEMLQLGKRGRRQLLAERRMAAAEHRHEAVLDELLGGEPLAVDGAPRYRKMSSAAVRIDPSIQSPAGHERQPHVRSLRAHRGQDRPCRNHGCVVVHRDGEPSMSH